MRAPFQPIAPFLRSGLSVYVWVCSSLPQCSPPSLPLSSPLLLFPPSLPFHSVFLPISPVSLALFHSKLYLFSFSVLSCIFLISFLFSSLLPSAPSFLPLYLFTLSSYLSHLSLQHSFTLSPFFLLFSLSPLRSLMYSSLLSPVFLCLLTYVRCFPNTLKL